MKWLLPLLLLPSLVFGQAFTFSDLPFLAQGSTDWQTRVVANGGAMPSANTISAMETLRLGCIAAGLTNKIYSLCVFVPDSLIAASTPLFLHKGYPMWTNSNFAATNLDINGLKGDGTSKSLDTGCMAKALSAGGVSDTSDGSRGLTVIVTESTGNVTGVPIGYEDADGALFLELEISAAGATVWLTESSNPLYFTTTNDFGRVGYVSGNTWNDANTNASIYVASPLETHKVLATKTIPDNGGSATLTDDTISVFARKQDGTNTAWSAQRLSLAMVHDGFTAAESASFWTLALACRQQLGGGTGDPIHDYNRKVVAAGGANISTTTSNALRTFYGGLNTDGILYLMSVVNPVVPDNLTAARTPVIWQSGSEIWTNFNFAASNLTVAGLQGITADSKYLGTGIVPSTANRISTTSAGMTGVITDSPGTGTQVILAGNPSTANVGCHFLTTVSGNDNVLFRMWRFDLVNTNFLSSAQPSPGDTWTGYISGNRINASNIALYVASTILPHAALTNGNNQAQTGTAAANTVAMLAWANNNNGTPASFGAHRMSFVAFHGGLTEAQSANLYSRIHTFRTAVGGGSP